MTNTPLKSHNISLFNIHILMLVHFHFYVSFIAIRPSQNFMFHYSPHLCAQIVARSVEARIEVSTFPGSLSRFASRLAHAHFVYFRNILIMLAYFGH